MTSLEGWEPAPARVAELDGVHVWGAQVTELAGKASGYYDEILSSPERARADAFRFDNHRVAYVVSHALVRCALALYVGTRTDELEFETSSAGRPSLATRPGPEIDFNLSHSGNFAAVAVGARNRVGVDVEEKRPNLEVDALARRFFSDAENQELSALKPEDAIEAFYTIWTRKEAVMKAVGRGLSMGIDSFSVSLGSAHQLVSSGAGEAWTVVDLGRSPSYAGALAMSVDEPVRRFRWRG